MGRIGILAHSVVKGPASFANYTRNLIINLIELVAKENDVELCFFREKSGFEPNFLVSWFYDKIIPLELLKCKLDVIHIPHLGGASSPSLLFIFNKLKGKLVVTLHGVAPLVVPSKIYYGGRAFIPKMFTYLNIAKWRLIFRKKIDRMIAVSNSEKRNIITTLCIPEDKIEVIYHGVDHNFFRPLDKIDEVKNTLNKKYRIGNNPFIFHVSSYQPKKNVLALIKAFHGLRNELKEYKLVLAGKHFGQVRNFVRKLNLERRVIFTGFLSDNDLPKFYNAAEVFAFPSFHESFGMPILEAMACGCPVITSNVFSMPEIAGDAALLVNPYSVEDITNALYSVLTDEHLRRELRRKGLKRAKHFSWRKCAQEHLKIYKELCNHGGR